MSSASDPKPPARQPHAQISIGYRRGLMALGFAGLGSGGAAVFLTHLEAGPVGLLLVGLVLLVIGVGGRLPDRIKVGDNEIAWDAIQDFVLKAAERTPADETPDLLADLNDLAKAAPQAASAGISVVAYEQLINRMVYDTFTGLTDAAPARVGVSGLEGTDRGRDMVIDFDDRALIVQVKYYSRSDASDRALLDQATDVLTDRSDVHADRSWRSLLIVAPQLTRRMIDVTRRFPARAFVVIVRGPQDRDYLAQAIRAALGLTGRNSEQVFGADDD
ncbi:MAG TPA: hypothetical protein VMA72_14145 [Streptosporangiaceae bacterium]|nr:hypothetical protein [Streptosporangiaceae bacterium]